MAAEWDDEKEMRKLLDSAPTQTDWDIIARSLRQRQALSIEKSQRPRETLCDKCPEPYGYDALPPRSIRLLKVYPFVWSIHDPLVVSLHVVGLDDGVPFDALSYTWGPPTWTAKEQAATEIFTQVSRCYPVYCGNSFLLVTRNLRDALIRLRMMQYSAESKDHFMSNIQTPMASYLWIDELCINQEHIEERDQQVSIMGQLYSRANAVIAWLGEEDSRTRMGLDMLNPLGQVMTRAHELRERVSFISFRDDKFWQRVGVRRLSTEQWLAFIELMTREWFSRTWVVQEIALPSRFPMFLCGSILIPAREAFTIMSFLLVSGWSQDLRNIARDSYPPDRARYIDRLVALFPFEWIHNIRDRTEKGEAFPFYSLQAFTFPRTHCLDPRDKVYATKALAAEFVADGKTTFGVSYNEPVIETYIRASRHCLDVTRSLDLLSITVHQYRASYIVELRDLPSWCPNYFLSEPENLRPQPVDLQPDFSRSPSTFTASKRSIHISADASSRSPLLKVRGLSLGTVEEVADAPIRLDYRRQTRLLDLLLRLEPPPGPSRTETYWRTLVTDMYDPDDENQPYPASLSTQDCYFVILLFCISRDFQEGLHLEQPYKKEYEELATRITQLLQVDPTAHNIFPDVAHYLSLPPDRLADLSFWDIEFSVLPRDAISTSTLSRNIHAKGRGRRLFRTSDQRLGTGYETIRAGDEIWLLAGGRVPYVLRSRENGNYEFQGEAYVHGIMMGEAWPEDEGELEDIVLE